VAGYIRSHVIF